MSASDKQPTTAQVVEPPRPSLFKEMRTTEDWWAIWCAGLILAVSFLAVWFAQPENVVQQIEARKKVKITSPLKAWLALPGSWEENPGDAFYKPASEDKEGKPIPEFAALPGIAGSLLFIGTIFAVAMQIRKGEGLKFAAAFPLVFLLAIFSFLLANQTVIKASNFEYVVWALAVGLIICNTVGTPDWLKPAVATEFYIKTGLVLLGAEILLSRLVALGLPGIFVSWVVTPIVLIGTYIFGQKVLKIESRSLNMVISADMSVCGVSAAIATGAACRAKKEELSLAIGISLAFTAIMMIVMPAVIKAIGMDEVLGGAWIGGTIDSSGAVAAAGAVVGKKGLEVATTVKMIQTILIGVIAFGVAVYWAGWVERDRQGPRVGASEIWYRFPKFIIGFVLASVVFSTIYGSILAGPELVDGMIGGSTKTIREWLFCLAFVSIGLETNFRELSPYLRGGKPLVLYVCGQTLNLVLTLVMAWLMFYVVFPDAVK